MDDPHDLPEPWLAPLRRGLELSAAGDPAALEHIERAYALAPGRAETACALGRERRRAGRVSEAEVLLAAATRADPSFTTAAAELARCLGLGGRRFAEAHDALDRAIAAGATAAPLEVVRAELWLEEDRPAEARRAVDAALAARPSAAVELAARSALARVENAAGVTRAASGELDAALFSFKRAADLDPQWSAPLVNQGLAFERLGRLDRARRAYQAALAVGPDNERAHLNLGLLHARRGEVAAARASLEAAIDLAPGWPPALAALASLSVAAGELSEALALLGEAAAGAPDEPAVWLELGRTLAAAGEADRAEDALRHSLELAPQQVEARLGLAELLVRDGRYLEAARLADEARALDPALAEVVLAGRGRVPSE